MIVTLSKWGNSLGLRIPRGVAEDAALEEGSTVDVRVENGQIVVAPVSRPSLSELLKRVNANNCHHDEFASRPVGREQL